MRFEDHTVRLAIADDGVGMGETEPGARVGFGMGNLRQRVEDLHGTLDVQQRAGRGHAHRGLRAGDGGSRANEDAADDRR